MVESDVTGSPNQQPEFVDNRNGNTLERALLEWRSSLERFERIPGAAGSGPRLDDARGFFCARIASHVRFRFRSR